MSRLTPLSCGQSTSAAHTCTPCPVVAGLVLTARRRGATVRRWTDAIPAPPEWTERSALALTDHVVKTLGIKRRHLWRGRERSHRWRPRRRSAPGRLGADAIAGGRGPDLLTGQEGT